MTDTAMAFVNMLETLDKASRAIAKVQVRLIDGSVCFVDDAYRVDVRESGAHIYYFRSEKTKGYLYVPLSRINSIDCENINILSPLRR